MNNIRITLKSARVNSGLKQEEVANIMNVTRKTLSGWESETETAEPRITQAIKLAKLYNLPIESIIFNKKER